MLVEARNVTRSYPNSGNALDGVSLDIEQGEFLAIMGPSGCGKSTLLHLLGGLDTVTSGEITSAGLALHTATDAQLTEYRRQSTGFVFQFFHLLPSMTVLENTSLPLLLANASPATARERAEAMLELAGMKDRMGHFPHQLSGGQMQRAAIARALVHHPLLLLADEPTGNLDSTHAAQVIELFQKIASQQKTTLVIVTHSEEVGRIASRRVWMRDGRLAPPPT